MDSFTHIVLGAVVGEVAGGKQLGRRAMLIGAAVQYLPDIDVVAALWLHPAENLMVHRGITHSLFFILVAGGVLTLFARKVRPGLGFWFWARFFFIQLLTHIFIDSFNAYGVGFFEPFHDHKYSFNTLYVADPFFTVWSLAAVVALLFATSPHVRKAWAIAGIACSIMYLGYGIYNKSVVVEKVNAALASDGTRVSRMLVTPTPLNSWLWFVAVGSDDSYKIGHVSVFDQENATNFRTVPIREELLSQSEYPETVSALHRFSQGYFVVEQWSDTLVYNDLKFGQMKGWENPDNRFVFHYFVNYPDQNMLVMQRGRFAGWTTETVKRMGKRIFTPGPSRADGSRK